VERFFELQRSNVVVVVVCYGVVAFFLLGHASAVELKIVVVARAT
jgi:hypothetical protein